MKTPNKPNPTDNKVYVQENLKVYFPILFELLDGNKLNWKNIEKAFINNFNYHKTRQSKSSIPVEMQGNFYTLVSSVINKKPDAIRLLDFIQKLFEELNERLNKNEKKLIRGCIYSMLINMDAKYLSFLGELLALNHLKKKLAVELIEVERPVDVNKKEGKTIDFIFLDKISHKELSIEIVNILLTANNTANDEKVNILLAQKLNEKVLDKRKITNSKFNLIPVLWGQWKEIKIIGDFYVKNQLNITDITIPICFMTFTDSDGVMIHKTGTIDTIFKDTGL